MSENTDSTNQDKTLRGVQRAFNIFEDIVAEGTFGVTELANQHDMPTSTMHAYLQTLEQSGYLENERGTYKPTFKLLELAGIHQNQSAIFHAARKPIDNMAKDANPHTNVILAVRENDQRVLLYQARGEQALYSSPIGDRAPLHTTATGKAILAEMPRSEVEELYGSDSLPTKTQHSIDNREDLFQELETIQERHFAVEDHEYKHGVNAIGKSVIINERPVAAVSLSGPTSELREDTWEDVSDKLYEVVNKIELQLGDHDDLN